MPMSNKQLFVANVGANASHGTVASPLYEDGNFDLITIPEREGELNRTCLRYRDLSWHDWVAVLAILGPQKWRMATHNDPDLWNGVYGDVPHVSPRAAVLRHARAGDALLFFARLRPFTAHGFSGSPGFFLVGGWSLHKVIDVGADARFRIPKRAGDNPHVRKWLAGSRERFSLFLARTRGVRFVPPIRMDRSFLERNLPESKSWNWTSGRSPLQVIGSHLRTVRAVNGKTHPGLARLLESEAR